MAFNPSKPSSQLELSVFGSLCTENSFTNLPEGVSPDNQDVSYKPGAVMIRPGLKKVFSTPLGATTVTYAKSYTMPNGQIINLYLDSSGNLWQENVSLAAGTALMLGSVTPGSYAKSVTAFGREYLAISDGLHGSDVPLQFDGTNLDRVTQDGPGANPTISWLQLPKADLAGSGFTLVRANNIVTARTATAHGLQPGYMFQLADIDAEPLGFITKIVIDNTAFPGIGTVTIAAAHNLAAGQYVSLQGISASVIGTSVSQVTRAGGVVKFSMTTAIFISAGAIVEAAGVTDPSFNTVFVVAQVTAPNEFIAYQSIDADASSSAGTVSLVFPNLQSPPNNLFQISAVISVDTVGATTTFQIPISYSNGTWTGSGASGPAVFTPWAGTFFVQTVVNSTTFTYQQYGCDDSTNFTGTVTPQAQIAPGVHQMQTLYLTRQGAITRPSPPMQFQANGGQYLQLSNLPIGPGNVVARIFAFTGAGGANFFYIPVPGEVNGQQVSTATQINDNTTTGTPTPIVLDFSDNTLFASLGITIPGNNLPAQIVLDSALGFGFFDSRLIAYGQRNKIQNLLNMGFDGGFLPSDTSLPTGWTAAGGGSGGSLAAGRFNGGAWQCSGAGSIFQSFYQDAYGAPIGTPNTKYIFRAYLGSTGSATATISSVIGGYSITASVSGIGWQQAPFGSQIPNIPSDTILSISGTGLIDELSIIYAQNPFLDTILYGSYVNNPEGFDGTFGKFGPSEDARKVMDLGLIRGNLFLLTQEPSGRIHSVSGNGYTEPAGWTVNEIAADCGALSAFSLSHSQADDASGSGGEEWFSWASLSGARIFSGDVPYKISQEIQPDWEAMNPSAFLTVFGLNDYVNRVIYFGLPTGTATAPNLIYPVDYKQLDTAFQVGMNAPIHTSYSGKLIATDHTRKWTRWNLTMNGMALMYRQPGMVQPVLFAGNGQSPGLAPGTGNVYILTYCNLTDDDFGNFFPYYTTYGFTTADSEQFAQLGGQRKTLTFFQFYAIGSASSHVRVTPLVDNLKNPWPIVCLRNLSPQQNFDIEWPGANVNAQRIFFKFEWLLGTI